MSTSVYQQGGAGSAALFPSPIVAKRDPTSTDVTSPSGLPYQVFQGWNNSLTDDSFLYTGSGNWVEIASIVGSVDELAADSGTAVPSGGVITIAGSGVIATSATGSTLTVASTAGGYPITPFVVGADGGYATIQDGLDAANSASGGLVFVQPGTYTEDLTLYDACPILGASFDQVTITGEHTPPASGSVMIENCTLTDADNIFTSAAAGTTQIILEQCIVTVTNGYVFNLTNWTGSLEIYDSTATGTNNGYVTNTGGSALIAINSTIGVGTGNSFASAGTVTWKRVNIGCPGTIGGTGTATIEHCAFDGTITTASSVTVSITNSSFATGATAAISHGSSSTFDLASCVVDSSNSPAIDGAGAGTINIADVVFLDNSEQAATLTLGTADVVQASTFRTTPLATQIEMTGNTIQASGSDTDIDINILPAGDGQTVLNEPAVRKMTFLSSPLLTTDVNTGGVPTGGTGDVNLMHIGNGVIMEQFILGTGTTIICPKIVDGSGLSTGLDETNALGAEYNFGAGRSTSPYVFVIGTSPAFFIEWTMTADDVGGLSPWLMGFRLVQANNATLANYTDFASIGADTAETADSIIIETQLNTGGVATTDTTDAWTDGQTKVLQVLVSAAGVVTYTINGAPPSTTAAFTFDNGDSVCPFIRHTYGATTPDSIYWGSFRCGLQ